jgi:Fe-S-cluster containining protein
MFNLKAVETKSLSPDTKFKFRCYPGIGCFTKCCSNIDIMLTPYDVLRLKNRLDITSAEFLDKYTMMRVDDKSSHPYAYLKMGGEDRVCPFLGSLEEGCTVYSDRPVSCRYYPVGQGTVKKREGDELVHEEFYFFVRENHCKGYEEDTEWTIQSWREDQDSAGYDEMNREWKEVLMRRNLPGKKGLDQKKQMQFFMASYDLDRFRSYVFDSRFLDVFDVPEEEVERMRTDEVALMKFAFRYIKFLMMMEETLKLKKGAAPGDGPKPGK